MKGRKKKGRDLIGTLPGEVLQHVLSFLPSRDAVHSSLLSRRWRDLWKSAPAVRVSGKGAAFRRFVDNLLHHRNDAAQLRSFEIDDLVIGPTELIADVDYVDDSEDDDLVIAPWEGIDDSVDRWVMHALSTCRATSLTACFDEEIGVLWLPRDPDAFASRHLTTMHLELVELVDGLLDFSSCPALLNLTLRCCRLNGDALVSPSLERLFIIHCDIPIGRYTAGGKTTMRISTPRLRHMQISESYDMEQTVVSLDKMPWLTTASIRLTGDTEMYPGNNRHGCSLLAGLSEVTTLEIIAPPIGMEILDRDLKWCPEFTDLKTLTLNKWCVYDDVTALACLLRHTPTLEQLILRLNFESHDAPGEKTELGSYISSQQLCPTLENLKTVEIKRHCPYSDTRENQILKLLNSWGIPRGKVTYQPIKRSEL